MSTPPYCQYNTYKGLQFHRCSLAYDAETIARIIVLLMSSAVRALVFLFYRAKTVVGNI